MHEGRAIPDLDAGHTVHGTALAVAIADSARVLTGQLIVGSARDRDAEHDLERQVFRTQISRIEGIEEKRVVTEARTSVRNYPAICSC